MMSEKHLKTYAAYYDNNVRLISSSGGIFSALAECYQVVYGVSMSEDNYSAKYVRREKEFSDIRGSKYMQADVADAYILAKEDLDQGLMVLFSGTPCQINGFKSFIGKNYDNLLCVEIICHGVSSQKMWKKHVEYLEEKHGKLECVDFRFKRLFYKNIAFQKNQMIRSKESDMYMCLYLQDIGLRPSCYVCHAKQNHTADITLGDFWNIDKVLPGADNGKGVSLVIIRTKNGDKAFANVDTSVEKIEVNYNLSVNNNIMEFKSVDKPIAREEFYEDLNKLNYEDLVKKYVEHPSVKAKLKMQIKILIKKHIRNMIRQTDYFILYSFKK